MSKSNGQQAQENQNTGQPADRAVALRYDPTNGAPVIVASGMGYMAERIVETASEAGVPVYEDNSLATVLSQLELGKEIPEELYQAIVEIYLYFLKFDPSDPEKYRRERRQNAAQAQQQEENAQAEGGAANA